MNKTFVVFLSPGSLFPNEQHVEVLNRGVKVNVPNNCFGYYFYDRAETTLDGETLYGQPKNKSGRTYIGEVVTIEQVEKELPQSILYSNMRSNKWDKVVRTRMGNYQPIESGDTVIPNL